MLVTAYLHLVRGPLLLCRCCRGAWRAEGTISHGASHEAALWRQAGFEQHQVGGQHRLVKQLAVVCELLPHNACTTLAGTAAAAAVPSVQVQMFHCMLAAAFRPVPAQK